MGYVARSLLPVHRLAVPRQAVPRQAMPCLAKPYRASQSHAVPHFACYAPPCRAMPCPAVPWYALVCRVVLFRAILYRSSASFYGITHTSRIHLAPCHPLALAPPHSQTFAASGSARRDACRAQPRCRVQRRGWACHYAFSPEGHPDATEGAADAGCITGHTTW